MSRKVLNINKPSDELLKFVKKLSADKEKERQKLIANKHLYLSK